MVKCAFGNHATDHVLTTAFFIFISQLFLFLQDFSQRMLSKTHDIEKQLDSLIRDTKATDSRLHSVFNDFLMLSNTQFIENVMYLFNGFTVFPVLILHLYTFLRTFGVDGA